jgi:hypothetical protein
MLRKNWLRSDRTILKCERKTERDIKKDKRDEVEEIKR